MQLHPSMLLQPLQPRPESVTDSPLWHTHSLSLAHANSLTGRGYVGTRQAGHRECCLASHGSGAC